MKTGEIIVLNRRLGKIISIILVIHLMSYSAISTISTISTISVIASTDQQLYAGNQLKILGLMKGYSNGELKLDNNIIRAEVAALLVRTLGYSDRAVLGEGKAFSDVKTDYWAFGDIQKAYKLKLIVGDPGGTFRPSDKISYGEVITIMVNALGKNNNLVGSWPNNYINRAKEIGIISKNINENPARKVTRGEVAEILWNTILVKR